MARPHSLGRQLERPPQPIESASAEAHRMLYFALAGAIEAGLVSCSAADGHRRRSAVQTTEDVLRVLRQASQPLGPMGAEWLARQERALKRGDG
jgi:hypothetical protein